jgi:hypothetical protein
MQSSTATATSTVTVSTTAATTSEFVLPAGRHPKSPWNGAGGGLVLAGLLWLFSPGSRNRFRSMGALVLVTMAIGGFVLSGCGGAGGSPSTPITTSPGTTAGSYTVTVTATGNDAQKTTSKATFTLTVQE